MPFGLTAFGRSMGERVEVADVVGDYVADPRPVLNRGYRALHRSSPEVGATDLAAEAAKKAMAEAGVSGTEVDLVVLAVADVAEYLYWDPAASLQARIGAHRAEAVWLNQACIAGVMSFEAVAGKFFTHPDYRVAVIVSANRFCDAYLNRMNNTSCVVSDGAVAAVARRGHRSCRWLASEMLTDGRYADLFRLEHGGTARPFDPARGEDVRATLDVSTFFKRNGSELARFVQALNQRSRAVLERACVRGGIRAQDVARVVYLNDNRSAMMDLAAALDIPLERTNAELGFEHGHIGCADQLFGLQEYVETGEVDTGDVVALSSIGRGMHWACTLVQV